MTLFCYLDSDIAVGASEQEQTDMPSNGKQERFMPVTPEGRAFQKAAERYLARIKTPEDAFEALKRIGIYNEDGTPNPYFFPEKNKDGKG